MPTLRYSITSLGLELPILVGLDQVAMLAFQSFGAPVPRPRAASALVDTGSDVSCVDAILLQQIGATRTATLTTQTASGQHAVQLSRVSLSIPSSTAPSFVVPNLTVMELPVAISNIEILLGMDIVNLLRVNIDGPNGTFELNY